MVDFFRKSYSFSARAERLLQKTFTLIAVEPSADLNLVDKENLTLAGDGICVHCHSSYYGTKVCKCRENCWYYGYTLYALSTYNKQYKIANHATRQMY